VSCCSASTSRADPLELRDGDRVVLLGGTFIERMQQHGYLESMVLTANPHKNITFRNLGWSGDTVFGDSRGVFGKREDGFKRLIKDVTEVKPTVIVVAYGNNEAFWGEDGLGEFERGLNRLLDEMQKTKARVLLVTPHRCRSMGPPFPDMTDHNHVLAAYAQVIRNVASQRSHSVADLYAAMSNINKPNYSSMSNGIHLNKSGYYGAAATLSNALGANPNFALWRWTTDRLSIDFETGSYDATGVLIHNLEVTERGIRMEATSEILLPVQGMLLWDSYMSFPHIEIVDIPRGEYELRVDGDKLEKAIVSYELGQLYVSWHEEDRSPQVKQLREAIRKKNELYFHRYRPQNETYLFLFRKHEQGNNAVEIPQFDPLIEAQEKLIAVLKKPRKHVYEIVRVEN
jgi:lysophospholipase L1-like esterase